MAVNIKEADEYIAQNCIDIEDWTGSDEARKQRLINVAERTINKRYSNYTIPDEAIYEFTNVLSIMFNDTNRYQQSGVASISVTGVSTVNFKDGSTNMPYADLSKFIPQSALDLIGEANGGITLRTRRIGQAVL